MAGFVAALIVDQKREWKPIQKEFRSREIAKAHEKIKTATTEEEKAIAIADLKIARNTKMEIRQIWVPETDVVDRCITCHLGHDSLQNPSMITDYPDHPFKATAGNPGVKIHELHNTEAFGCTVCHGGQGYATEIKAAHGEVHHWEKPLLKGALLQASCIQCHDNNVNLEINEKNYVSEIVHAKNLFREFGCIGCHQIGGEGGVISVDLKYETSVKPLSRIDFAYSGLPHDERTLANWIKIHLTQDPQIAVPGDPFAELNSEPISPSAMPPYLLNERDANALTAYVLGLNQRDVPQKFIQKSAKSPKPQFSSAEGHGRWVYEEYGCAGCHGGDARGGVRNYNYRYDVTPNLRRVLTTYSREEVKEKINHGVPFVAKHNPNGPTPPLYMPAWKEKIKGQELEDLVTYLFSIRE